MRETLLNIYSERCEIFCPETTTSEVTVGVVDSVYDPGDDFKEFNTVGRTFDIINAGKDATVHHGFKVSQLLSAYTSNPEYHFFQVVDKNGKSRDSYLMKALGLAMDYGEVDVLNMSIGADHISDPDRDCTEARALCPLCEVAEEAVEQGITIVAAAGNRPFAESVCCPSLSSLVISVGGTVTRCTASVDSPGYIIQKNNRQFPDNALWVERDDDHGSEFPLCSNRGCMPGESCQENRNTKPWDSNVDFTDRKPDILAPAYFVWEDEIGPCLLDGTSFSCPIVTAGIISMVEWAQAGGSDVTPVIARNAIHNSGHEFENIDRRYFSAQKFANEVRRLKGLPPESFGDSHGGPIDL